MQSFKCLTLVFAYLKDSYNYSPLKVYNKVLNTMGLNIVYQMFHVYL